VGFAISDVPGFTYISFRLVTHTVLSIMVRTYASQSAVRYVEIPVSSRITAALSVLVGVCYIDVMEEKIVSQQQLLALFPRSEYTCEISTGREPFAIGLKQSPKEISNPTQLLLSVRAKISSHTTSD